MTAAPSQPRTIRLEAPNYIVRTVEPGDANESWCKWLLDPVAARQLNARPAAMTMDQLGAYIARFDRVNSHLLGIFEKTGGRLVGIRSIYIDHARKAFLDNILIGEVDARAKTARSESTDVIQPFFFEELGLLSSHCGILAENTHMLELVARKGWELERTDRKPAAAGGGFVELWHYKLTREAWRRKRGLRPAAS